MKHTTRLRTGFALLMTLMVASWTFVPAQDPDARAQLYARFYELRTPGNEKARYDVAKEFVQKYPAPEDNYLTAVKKYIKAYEEAQRYQQYAQLQEKEKYDEAFDLGKKILADSQERAGILYSLTMTGWIAAQKGNAKNNAETADFARQCLTLINQGATFEKGKPIPEKDKVVASLNYALGTVLPSPQEKISYLLLAAQSAAFQKDAALYYRLATLYQEGEFESSRKTYTDLAAKSADSPETKAAKLKADESVDRLIDALARAVAHSTDAKYAEIKKDSQEQLAPLYKYRNNSETGLTEFIAGITARPIPQPGQPINYFPNAGETAKTETTRPADPVKAPKNKARPRKKRG